VARERRFEPEVNAPAATSGARLLVWAGLLAGVGLSACSDESTAQVFGSEAPGPRRAQNEATTLLAQGAPHFTPSEDAGRDAAPPSHPPDSGSESEPHPPVPAPPPGMPNPSEKGKTTGDKADGKPEDKPDAMAPPQPDENGPAPAPPTAVVVRATEINAAHIVAGTIFAEKIEAKGAQIEHVHQSPAERRWQGEVQPGKLNVAEIVADVIYAKDIKVGWLEAKHVFAKDVKIEQLGFESDGGP
jgi:hypothetical protein